MNFRSFYFKRIARPLMVRLAADSCLPCVSEQGNRFSEKLIACMVQTTVHDPEFAQKSNVVNRGHEHEADLWVIRFLLSQGMPLAHDRLFTNILNHTSSESGTHPSAARRMQAINKFLANQQPITPASH